MFVAGVHEVPVKSLEECLHYQAVGEQNRCVCVCESVYVVCVYGCVCMSVCVCILGHHRLNTHSSRSHAVHACVCVFVQGLCLCASQRPQQSQPRSGDCVRECTRMHMQDLCLHAVHDCVRVCTCMHMQDFCLCTVHNCVRVCTHMLVQDLCLHASQCPQQSQPRSGDCVRVCTCMPMQDLCLHAVHDCVRVCTRMPMQDFCLCAVHNCVRVCTRMLVQDLCLHASQRPQQSQPRSGDADSGETTQVPDSC